MIELTKSNVKESWARWKKGEEGGKSLFDEIEEAERMGEKDVEEKDSGINKEELNKLREAGEKEGMKGKKKIIRQEDPKKDIEELDADK